MKITRQFDLVLKIGIVILTLLTMAMIYLYLQVDKVLSSTRQEMTEMIIDRYGMELSNAARLIEYLSDGALLEKLEAQPALRLRLQQNLAFYKTPEIDNIFVIYRDKRGKYRYLLDAEMDPEKQAMFKQRFEPVSNVWDNAYKSGEKQFFKHVKNGTLWVSVAVPIIEKGRVAAVLGSDLSASIRTDVQRRFSQIKTLILSVAVIIGILLIFGYIQIYYYFKGRSRSFIDPLTGACNRKFLYEVLANGNYEEYQIIMYDVDHFKEVNDTYGHDTGDDVLKMLTKRVKRMLRREDYLVRFGGEEFIIFLKTNSQKEAMEVAERIKKTVETSPFVIGDNILHITISVGINDSVISASNLDEAIEKADIQLYCAKNAGRNRICVNNSVVL
ncbi:diguanylate cyclase [Hydrogenimonas urashimensis]|uniref:diguanylate cyclase n=1 Tax=Hydrogenimonas urashimensis TaxID=2740515 RepID=UPI00191508B2|nr:diguanylate cyclase [Hydrogenimonas urashimensis]